MLAQLVDLAVIRVEPVAQTLEGGPGHLVGNLGTNFRRERDSAMPKDLHSDARVYIDSNASSWTSGGP